jgi:hypothetical protein
MVYVFVNSTLHGPGYIVSTVGLLIIGVGILATLWWGAIKQIKFTKAEVTA